jgi:protein KTI12
LIILTGYPCSGLSYRAKQLAALLESTQDQLLSTNESEGTESAARSRYKFHVVPSHDTSHPRTVYGTARTEKEARAVTFTRVKRALGRDTFVILDGMNYIKGWRYQLWCEAKAVGTTCCTVCLVVFVVMGKTQRSLLNTTSDQSGNSGLGPRWNSD